MSIYILFLQHLSLPFNVLRKIHILKYTFIFPTSFRDISSRFCLLTRKKKRKEKYTFLSSKLTRSKETSRCILLPRNVARFIRYFSNIPIRCIQVLRTETSSIPFHSIRPALGENMYIRAYVLSKNLRDGKRRYFVRGIIDISPSNIFSNFVARVQ